MITDKKLNSIAMELISYLKPCTEIRRVPAEGTKEDSAVMQSIAVNRAIDALYMQNKILDHIEALKEKPCFITDSEGVIKLLSSVLVGHEENI